MGPSEIDLFIGSIFLTQSNCISKVWFLRRLQVRGGHITSKVTLHLLLIDWILIPSIVSIVGNYAGGEVYGKNGVLTSPATSGWVNKAIKALSDMVEITQLVFGSFSEEIDPYVIICRLTVSVKVSLEYFYIAFLNHPF